MHVFEMVIWIVAISCLTGVLTEYFKTQRKNAAAQPAEADDDLLAEIDDLRERVETLEAIVTDRKSQLRDELDNLKVESVGSGSR